MRFGTAIERLVDNYRYAKGKVWIRDEVAWALYQTWKEADRKTEQTEYKKWETKPTADIPTENTTCVGVAMALVEDDFFREPTAEERKAVADYIDSISIPTGVNIFDLMDEPQTCDTCKHKYKQWTSKECDSCCGNNSHYEPIEDEPQTEVKVEPTWVGVTYGRFEDEPQIDGAIDEARFKAHCMNCRRDVADIKCLDCDGDKYFIADEPQERSK